MKKQTKVLAAAALFTLGATFSSMAALKNGTWSLDEDGWHYVNKDGDYEDSVWAMSYGKEYWINDDGVLGSCEWVKDENEYSYYAQSDGSKTVNAWKYIYGEDDEDDDDVEEESWFYFNSKGRMVTGKQTIGGKTYYFGTDGKMLTGWVKKSKTEPEEVNDDKDVAAKDLVFCGDDGAVVKNAWIEAFTWREDEDDLVEEDDLNWYFADSDGDLYANKVKKINGLKYAFNPYGEMLTGWVQKIDGSFTDAETAISAATEAAYFADEDDGHLKLNSWRYLDDPTGEDDTYWYHFDKNGKAFIATDANAIIDSYEVEFTDGEKNVLTPDTAKVEVNSLKIGSTLYYFNKKGEMIDGLQKLGSDLVYLKDGARQTGKVTIEDENGNDYSFYFAEDSDYDYTKYAAVSGNADGYCYKQGQLQKSDEKGEYKIVTIDGVGKFIVDYKGKIQKSGKKDYITEKTYYTFNTELNGTKKDSIATTVTKE